MSCKKVPVVLNSEEEANVVDDFLKFLVKGNVTAPSLTASEVSERWISLFEQTDHALYGAFEEFVGPKLYNEATTSHWKNLFSENEFMARVRDALIRLCEICPEKLALMFKNGYEICYFNTLYHGSIDYPDAICFAILGWYPPRFSDVADSGNNSN